jgi:hypothetical protein
VERNNRGVNIQKQAALFREAAERDLEWHAAIEAAPRWFDVVGQGRIRFYIRPKQRLPFHVELSPLISARDTFRLTGKLT